ncbi:cysteine-rich secretory protein LCCL domain-containing 2 [Polypterus senegalus]|uniref:cysteine-rich secretory protein LCCL domain-containing 2 n=1 Tax=Polypterus senegalus TaxID=55291 RepID=UPI0019658014|nr:cysteine-rich secretory protein LCCL domain-containing 2 [Polypterus senegalus]XP_039619258.1 cysteine-rich secretory protein LCCL domain-containing 2 [Polypterus senegalus]
MKAVLSWLCIPILTHYLSLRGDALFLSNSTILERLLSKYHDAQNYTHSRVRRAIQWSDREEIVNLHNKLRGNVHPSSSNMEYMVWDEELERSATEWAHQCIWEHGPKDLLMSIGQNLAVHWGRYRTPAYHVQAWYDEVKDYTYPMPHECNPWCPEHCSGPMCTHYTQIVWATTSKVGCAVHACNRMNVWGEIWENAIYLVCNYSPKGNWIGEAPYQSGRPCSQCPPSFGGGCKNNLCYKDTQVPHPPETEDMNEVETALVPEKPDIWPRPQPRTTPAKETPKKKETSKKYMTQVIKCDTKMRDKCRGSTCNRYECPANCQNAKGKIWGTLFYDTQSSLCRAALHFGVIDNSGGLVDITRKGQMPLFVKSTRNGVESLSKYKKTNAFTVSKVEVKNVDCYATVAELCPFKKPIAHCPRVYCAMSCKDEPSYWAPVYGTDIYSDSSSICRSAIHAGIITGSDGGYVDILPLEKKKHYVGTLRNDIQSESKKNPEGHSFQLFAVRV